MRMLVLSVVVVVVVPVPAVDVVVLPVAQLLHLVMVDILCPALRRHPMAMAVGQSDGSVAPQDGREEHHING